MKKIALSTLLGIALTGCTVLHAYEQPEPLVVDLSFDMVVYDNTDMANAPPGLDADVDPIISQSDYDADQILSVEWESPPGLAASFTSIDMETSADLYYSNDLGNRILVDYSLNKVAPAPLPPDKQQKGEQQADADTIALASTKPSLDATAIISVFDRDALRNSWEFL